MNCIDEDESGSGSGSEPWSVTSTFMLESHCSRSQKVNGYWKPDSDSAMSSGVGGRILFLLYIRVGDGSGSEMTMGESSPLVLFIDSRKTRELRRKDLGARVGGEQRVSSDSEGEGVVYSWREFT